MISPRVDKLLENVDSNYASVIVAAKRARQINSYYHNLGEGSFEALVERLMQRGSDSPEQIERRLAAAREELEARDEFDHHLVNDDLDRAVEELAELAATMCPP